MPRKKLPEYTEPQNAQLEQTSYIKPIPQATAPHNAELEPTMPEKPIPVIGNPENVVMIGNKQVEIFPTKVKYQRDKSAAFYLILRQVPLTEILSLSDGVLSKTRSSDKMLFDWLIAVTDDPKLIKEEYDNMDSEQIYKLLEVFCRVNHIDEVEKKAKAQMETA